MTNTLAYNSAVLIKALKILKDRAPRISVGMCDDKNVVFPVSSYGFQFLVSGFWFLVSGFWFPVSGFQFLVSSFWFPVSGF
jgi:hypothetical protein